MTYQGIVDEVYAERQAQDAQFGFQDLPMGTSGDWKPQEKYYRDACQRKTDGGTLTYLDILLEEVFEVAAEEDPAKLRDELIQMVAVGIKIIEALDRAKAAAGV